MITIISGSVIRKCRLQPKRFWRSVQQNNVSMIKIRISQEQFLLNQHTHLHYSRSSATSDNRQVGTKKGWKEKHNAQDECRASRTSSKQLQKIKTPLGIQKYFPDRWVFSTISYPSEDHWMLIGILACHKTFFNYDPIMADQIRVKKRMLIMP